MDRGDVRRGWWWRDQVTQQIVNTDVDGLLTGALLNQTKRWPIVGFYDTESLWLSDEVGLPLDLERTAWVDIDMCWPGSLSLSQHVISVNRERSSSPQAHSQTINPNKAVGCHGGSPDVYRDKYPFGTFQWTAWIAGAPDPPDPSDAIRTGLAWMPDGGFKSVNHASWRPNCLSWARYTLPGSLMSPLSERMTTRAATAVERAAAHVAGSQPLPPTWRNLQYVMSVNRDGPQPVVDVQTPHGLADVRTTLAALCDAWGWERVELPSSYQRFRGTWRASDRPPKGWPSPADDGTVVSFAMTGRRRYCWTEPSNNLGVPSLSAVF